MSQAGEVDFEKAHPEIPTSFVTNSGTAIPIANTLEILATAIAAYGTPVKTTGSGNTVTVVEQYSSASATSSASNAGLASFNSADFTVDANGYVSSSAISAITLDGDVGSATGSTLTVYAHQAAKNSGGTVLFSNSGSTSTFDVTDSNNNTFIGRGAGTSTNTSGDNTALGYTALQNIGNNVNYCTAIGVGALSGALVGVGNTAMGYQALASLTSGQYNVAIGDVAGANVTSLSNAVYIGYDAGASATAGSSVAIGYTAGTVDAGNNVFIGAGCGTQASGSANVIVGASAVTGTGASTQNALVGYQIGNSITSGSSNSGLGYASLNKLTTGTNNVSLGYETLFSLATGSSNTALGYNAGSAYTTSESNNICIGNGVLGTLGESNITRIGRVGQTACYVTGIDGVNVASTANVVTEHSNQLGTAVLTAGAGMTITTSANAITFAVSGSGVGETITGQTGGALSPTAGNWNISGNNSAQNGYASYTTGSGSTLTINSYGHTKWVVNANGSQGTHTTIASAIASASSGDDIFITPGTYTENPTLKAGVNLIAYAADATTQQVIINGTCTFSGAGTVSLVGITLQTNASYALTVSGSSASIVNCVDCFLNMTNNTGIDYTSSSASSQVNFYRCQGDFGTTGIGLFTSSGAGNLQFNDCVIFNTSGTTTSTTFSAGNLKLQYSIFKCPITITGGLINAFIESEIDTGAINVVGLTTTTGGGARIFGGTFTSGNAASISVGASTTVYITGANIFSTAAVPIIGSGTIQFGGLSFAQGNSGISTTTQSGYVQSNNPIQVAIPGAYPYTVLAQDAIIPVDSSSARTINLPSAPVSGESHVIKDNVGSAATNNITVSGNGNNIDGAASFIMSINFESITFCYNGTQWNII